MKFGLALAALSVGCLAQPGYFHIYAVMSSSTSLEIKDWGETTSIKEQEMFGLEIETKSSEQIMLLREAIML